MRLRVELANPFVFNARFPKYPWDIYLKDRWPSGRETAEGWVGKDQVPVALGRRPKSPACGRAVFVVCVYCNWLVKGVLAY